MGMDTGMDVGGGGGGKGTVGGAEEVKNEEKN